MAAIVRARGVGGCPESRFRAVRTWNEDISVEANGSTNGGTSSVAHRPADDDQEHRGHTESRRWRGTLWVRRRSLRGLPSFWRRAGSNAVAGGKPPRRTASHLAPRAVRHLV